MNIEYVIIVVVFAILLLEPNILKSFSNTIYGRLIFIAVVTFATLHKTYLGLLLVLAFVSLNGLNNVEGMTNKDVDDFRSTNCKNNELYKGDEKVSISQVANMFPNVKFSGDKCNPCDSNCQFSISTTTEQLTVEENIKPKPSEQFRTSKETVNKGANPGPSKEIRTGKNKSVNTSPISQ